jgi:hypothetical protein
MLSILLLAITLSPAPAVQHGTHGAQHAHRVERANQGMGFDQLTATHHFLLQRGGGTIEVTANQNAEPGTADQIRTHLQHIASAFAKGDFTLPIFIHETAPPGIDVMKARAAAMTFRFEELPAGGRVVIRTEDREALEALHAFLRFQIREHKTGDPMEPK